MLKLFFEKKARIYGNNSVASLWRPLAWCCWRGCVKN